MGKIEIKFDVGEEAYLIDEEETNCHVTYYRVFKAIVTSVEIYEDHIDYLLKDKKTKFAFRLKSQNLFKTREELMVEIERRLNDEEK